MKSSLYDQIAADYDRMVDMEARLAREIPPLAALLRAVGARRVVDVGCGTGGHVAALGREGFEVTGLDPSPSFIALAKQQPELPSNVTFEVTSFEDWTTRPRAESLDALLCLGQTLPHLTLLRSLEEVMRLMGGQLRPGGLLVLQLVNPDRIERLGAWTPPTRSWSTNGEKVTMMRQYVDQAESLQLVVTRVAIRPGRGQGISWDQHLPKVRASQIQLALLLGGWQEVAVAGGLSGQPFDPETSESMLVTAKRG